MSAADKDIGHSSLSRDLLKCVLHLASIGEGIQLMHVKLDLGRAENFLGRSAVRAEGLAEHDDLRILDHVLHGLLNG